MAYYRVTFGNRETIVECDQPMSYVGEIYKDRLIGECDEYGNLRVPYLSPETEAMLVREIQEFVNKHPQFIKDTQTPEQLAKVSEPTQEANKPFDVEGLIAEMKSALFSNLGLHPDSREYADLISQFGKQWHGGIIDYPPVFKPFSMNDEQNTPVDDTVANLKDSTGETSMYPKLDKMVIDSMNEPVRFKPISSTLQLSNQEFNALQRVLHRMPSTITDVQGILDYTLEEPFILPSHFKNKFYGEYYIDYGTFGPMVALYNLIMKACELREDIVESKGTGEPIKFTLNGVDVTDAVMTDATSVSLEECAGVPGTVDKSCWDGIFNPHFPNEFPPTRLDTRVSQSAANHECRKVVISALNDWKRRVDARHAYHSDQTQERTHLQEVQFKHIKRYAKAVVKSVLENTDDILVHIDVAEQDNFGFITGSADGKSHTRHFTVKFHEKN